MRRFWRIGTQKRIELRTGGVSEIQKLCAKSGIRVSKSSVKRVAVEMKAQEKHAEAVFQEKKTQPKFKNYNKN